MSLPPSDMQAVSDKTATRPRFTKRDWVRVGVLALFLSAGYLAIDIVLDPALLPHAARAGRLPVLLLLVGIGFFLSLAIVFELRAKRTRVEWVLNLLCCLSLGSVFPIVAIVWLDPYQPNARNGSVVFTALGLSAIGLTLFGLALVYGLSSAHRRYSREGAYAESGVPGREEVVGLGSLVWAATGVWFLAVVSASIYAIWLALTSPFDNAPLPMPFVIVCSALVLSISGLGWIWWYAGRYARRTGDAALLASTKVPSARRATQRVVVPPDERARWGMSLLVGLGILAFALVTFAVLDLDFIQSTYADGTQRWMIATIYPLYCWIALHRATARRYPPARFRRLLVAAAAFVAALDATEIAIYHLTNANVPPLGLLAISVLFSTLGVLICHSMLLHPMRAMNTEPPGTAPPDSVVSRATTTVGGQKRPRVVPYLLLLLPLCFAAEHLPALGAVSVGEEWAHDVFIVVWQFTFAALVFVVDTDMPRRQAQRPARKGA